MVLKSYFFFSLAPTAFSLKSVQEAPDIFQQLANNDIDFKGVLKYLNTPTYDALLQGKTPPEFEFDQDVYDRVNQKDIIGDTLLHKSIKMRDHKLFKYLLFDKHVDSSIQDKDGNSPAHLIILNPLKENHQPWHEDVQQIGDLQMSIGDVAKSESLEMLISRDEFDPFLQNRDGDTILHLAARGSEYPHFLHVILNHAIQKSAARSYNFEAMQSALLSFLDVRNNAGQTADDVADEGKLAILHRYREFGQRNQKLFMKEVSKVLQRFQIDDIHQRIMMELSSKPCREFTRELLSEIWHSDLNISDPFHRARSSYQMLEFLTRLMDTRCDLNFAYQKQFDAIKGKGDYVEGTTLMHVAAKSGLLPVVKERFCLQYVLIVCVFYFSTHLFNAN